MARRSRKRSPTHVPTEIIYRARSIELAYTSLKQAWKADCTYTTRMAD